MKEAENLKKMYLISKFFQKVKQSCFLGSPPSKELTDMFMKIGTHKSAETNLRIQCFKAMTRIFKAGAQNISVLIPDLVKNYIKIIEKFLSA